MEKKAVSGIMLTLLLISMLTLAFNIQPAKSEPGTIIVPDDYPTIQEAINYANEGDTVFVKAGTYYENVVVSKTLSLIGESSKTVVIDGNYELAVQVAANSVAISGFTIRHGLNGIRLQGFSNSIFSNNVTNNTLGVYLYYFSSSNMIVNNDITDNYYGIELDYSSSNTIYGNNIIRNGHGIWSVQSSYSKISYNKITNNSYTGVALSGGSSNSLLGNKIANNNFGIDLYGSSNNKIAENNITDNNCNGIETHGYHPLGNNIIHRNNIAANNGYGILLYGDYNTISQNKITVNNYGIGIAYASYNTISGNDITANSNCGIYLFWDSSGNIIFHNDLIDNTIQVKVEQLGHGNSWDDGYPSGGNYWSDYSGIDMRRGVYQNFAGSDGVGDTPYVIDVYNRDKYPLMKRWEPILIFTEPEAVVGVPVGETFTLRVNITNVRDLYGWQFKITYDPTIIDVTGVTQESFLKQAGQTVFAKVVDNTVGFVMAMSILNFPYPSDGAYGNGALANVTFRVKSNGQTLLQFDKTMTKLRSVIAGQVVPIEHETRDCYFSNLAISCNIDISPDTLNLKSRGKWITAYIQLPEGHSAADVDASTILLNGTISPVLGPKYGFVTNSSEYLADHNNDGILERMVKFNRTQFAEYTLSKGIAHGNVTLTLTGQLNDKKAFEGSDVVGVRMPGDVNGDGVVDGYDIQMIAKAWESEVGELGYKPEADIDEDGIVNEADLRLLNTQYGKTP